MVDNPIETVRVHQANERTMLAWIRTGIALMMLGFTIARFGLFLAELGAVSGKPASGGSDPAWLGALLVAVGVLTSLFATLRYRSVRDAILRGEMGAPSPLAVYAVGAATTVFGLVMGAMLIRSLL